MMGAMSPGLKRHSVSLFEGAVAWRRSPLKPRTLSAHVCAPCQSAATVTFMQCASDTPGGSAADAVTWQGCERRRGLQAGG